MWFHRFVHTSLDSIVQRIVNWSINSLFVEFWQVCCGCFIMSNKHKHIGKNSTGCWLGYGGGCLMQRQYLVKIIGNVSDWLSYAGGALIKVADLAGSTVYTKINNSYLNNHEIHTLLVQLKFD